jgi:hypothetical protein
MLTSLILGSLLLGPTTPDPDPALRIWFNRDEQQYNRGERVGVFLQTRDDQYVVVLHLDPDNRIRVLFPIDPNDDNYVRGGKRYKVLSRGGRDGFVAEVAGQGVVFAASSAEPFRFDEFAGQTYWDYRALNQATLDGAAEDRLVAVVERMATARFDYDLVGYAAFALDDELAPDADLGIGPDAIVECLGCGPNTTVAIGPAGPTWCVSALYDPMCYDPLHWSPGWVPPLYWNVGWGWWGVPAWGVPVHWSPLSGGGAWPPFDQYVRQASRNWTGSAPAYRPRGSTVATNTVVAPLPSTGRSVRADPRRGTWVGDLPVPTSAPAPAVESGGDAPRAEPRPEPRNRPRESTQDRGTRRTWSDGGKGASAGASKGDTGRGDAGGSGGRSWGGGGERSSSSGTSSAGGSSRGTSGGGRRGS